MVGGSPQHEVLKGHSLRKVENHCAKEWGEEARLRHQGRSSDMSTKWARLQPGVGRESQLTGTKKLQSL